MISLTLFEFLERRIGWRFDKLVDAFEKAHKSTVLSRRRNASLDGLSPQILEIDFVERQALHAVRAPNFRGCEDSGLNLSPRIIGGQPLTLPGFIFDKITH